MSDTVRLMCSDDWVGVSGVYFIAAQGSSAVKIGYSKNIAKRFADLCQQSVLPLWVAGACSGTLQTEKAIHRVYEHRRYHGEWFRVTAAMSCEFNLDYWMFPDQDNYWPQSAKCRSVAPCKHDLACSEWDLRDCVEECGRLMRRDSCTGELWWDSSMKHWREPELARDWIKHEELAAWSHG